MCTEMLVPKCMYLNVCTEMLVPKCVYLNVCTEMYYNEFNIPKSRSYSTSKYIV